MSPEPVSFEIPAPLAVLEISNMPLFKSPLLVEIEPIEIPSNEINKWHSAFVYFEKKSSTTGKFTVVIDDDKNKSVYTKFSHILASQSQSGFGASLDYNAFGDG